MEKQTKTATYLTHTIAMNEKKVEVLKMTFIFESDNSVTEVSIQSLKYLKHLSEKVEPYTGCNTYEELAQRIKQLGKVELYFNQSANFVGYSLTDSMYISAKNHMVKPYGAQVLITKVESDDSAIALYFEDGTVSKRNFATEVEINGKKEYHPDLGKKLRFLQALGIQGDLVTFDMQELVGGRCDYMKQDNAFKQGEVWFKHENFTKAPAQTAPANFGRDVANMTPEEQLAMMSQQG